MRTEIVLDPILSCEMINPAVKKLSELFEKGFNVIYVYGPPGTGKSLSINLLADEHDYQIYKFGEKIEDMKQVIGLSRFKNLIDPKKMIVLIDSIDTYTAEELEMLAKGDWIFNKLILVGENYPKVSNPISPFAKNKQYSFKKIKFDKLPEQEMKLLLSKIAIAYKKPLLKEQVDKIINAVDGDIRKLFSVSKNYFLAGGDLEVFLPQCEETEFNRVKRIFSGNYEAALEEIENFGWYYAVMIIAANLSDKTDKEELMSVLMKLSGENVEQREKLLSVLACRISKKYSKGQFTRWIFPKRIKKEEDVDVEAICSNIKKFLYYN